MKKQSMWMTLFLSLALTLSVSATTTESSIDTEDSTSYLLSATLDQDTLATITVEEPLVLTAEGVTISISSTTAEGFLQAGEDLEIALTYESWDNLTQEQQTQIGYNDCYHLSISFDGVTLLGWGDAPLSVTLPYTHDQGEVQVWQLSNSLSHSYGLVSTYDQETQSVTFETDESGYIGIASNPFTDVSVDRDDYIPILWAAEEGIVNGTDETLFSPDATCTRAIIATVFWRMSGEQEWGICYPYADVDGDQWYTDPIYWCTVNQIVNGYDDETFRPNQAITREQLVTMLYRYAQYLELDVSVGENTNILSYTDAFDISDYAISAFQWACGADVIEGNESALFPLREATRGELVTMLMRLSSLS